MGDIIKLLPDAIANQIAAGEVVQRPASVVKELMENAIDAGAGSVKLIVKDSGKTLIQVIDDGCGMSPMDARMSFERHATSKIREAGDLFSIRTMGFRGEALASIAAVAQVELRSRRETDELGTRLLIEGSEVKLQEAHPCAPGSQFAVRNLFYNVPARRNFLKSNQVEMRHILDEFQRIAMANPDIFFSLHHNNEELFHLPVGNLRQRIIGLLGQNYNQRLVPVEEETEILKIVGFVGKPEFAKKSRGEQYLFVNNRFIKSHVLHHAIVGAYEDLLAKENNPLYVLFLELDPRHIDVNVHPTKQEIKFDDEKLVYNYIHATVRHGLGKHHVTPSLNFDRENDFVPLPSTTSSSYSVDTVSSSLNSRSERAGQSYTEDRIPGVKNPADRREANNLRHWGSLYEGLRRPAQPLETDGESTFLPDEPTEEPVTIRSEWTEGRRVGIEMPAGHREPYQLHNTYIVSPIKSGFCLINQQSAHERILFERYQKMLASQQGLSQQQLFARTFSLPPAEALLLREMLPQLRALGFDIEPVELHSFAIKGLPADVAGKQDEQQLIGQLLEQYRNEHDLKLGQADRLAAAMAKSGAIRRGQVLTTIEMKNIIDQLFACELPSWSPSGRRCFVTYNLDDINSHFDA